MKLEEVEQLACQLTRRDQLELVSRISSRLSEEVEETDSEKCARRDRMFAALALCDEIAASIDGEFDSAEDLRQIRMERIADIERSVRG